MNATRIYWYETKNKKTKTQNNNTECNLSKLNDRRLAA